LEEQIQISFEEINEMQTEQQQQQQQQQQIADLQKELQK
jgi:hypothetical protein